MDELNAMLEAGTARKIAGNPFAFVEMEPSAKANAPEDLDSVPDEDPKVYETKVMTPETPKPGRRPRNQRFKPSAQPKDVA